MNSHHVACTAFPSWGRMSLNLSPQLPMELSFIINIMHSEYAVIVTSSHAVPILVHSFVFIHATELIDACSSIASFELLATPRGLTRNIFPSHVFEGRYRFNGGFPGSWRLRCGSRSVFASFVRDRPHVWSEQTPHWRPGCERSRGVVDVSSPHCLPTACDGRSIQGGSARSIVPWNWGPAQSSNPELLLVEVSAISSLITS